MTISKLFEHSVELYMQSTDYKEKLFHLYSIVIRISAK